MCLGNSHPVHPNADFNICGVPEMSDAIEAARLEREGECALSGYLFKKARGKSTGLLGTILHPGTLLHDHSWKERDFYLYSTRQLVYFAGAGEVNVNEEGYPTTIVRSSFDQGIPPEVGPQEGDLEEVPN